MFKQQTNNCQELNWDLSKGNLVFRQETQLLLLSHNKRNGIKLKEVFLVDI